MPEFVFVKPDRKAQLAEFHKECAGHSKRVEKTREAFLCALFFQEKTAILSRRFMDELNQLMGEINRRTGMIEAKQAARKLDIAFGISRVHSSDFAYKSISNSNTTFRFEDDASAAKRAAGHLREMSAAVNEIQKEIWEVQKSAKYLKENGFFWVAECVAPATANCKKAAPSIHSLGKFLNDIPIIPENPQPTQETWNRFKKLGDFMGRLFDEPLKTRILSFCDFDESNSSGTTKSISMFIRGLLTCFPQLQNDEKLLSLCVPLEDTGNVVSLEYGSLVHFSVSYMCDSIIREKRREILVEIARRNTYFPTFKKALPAAETIAKTHHPFPAQKKDPNNTKEAEFRKSFEKSGAVQEEIDALLSIKSTLLRLIFFTDAPAQLELYRAECGNGISPSQIAQKIALKDRKCADCALAVSNALSDVGINKKASQELAKNNVLLACARLSEETTLEETKQFARENAEEILLKAAEVSDEVYANLDFYLSLFCETFNGQKNGNQPNNERTLALPQNVFLAAKKAHADPLYVQAILSSFRFNGTIYAGAANIPKDPVRKKTMGKILANESQFFQPKYEKAESFLERTGILDIRGGRKTYRLITTESWVQNEIGKALIGPVREFYGR